MAVDRGNWLIMVSMAWLLPAALSVAALAQDNTRQVLEARIEHRQVVAPEETIRITEGDVLELRWTSDEAVELHLHGYDIELQVHPEEPATMVVEAEMTGRFPISSHGWGAGGHSHDHNALIYLEVYPR